MDQSLLSDICRDDTPISSEDEQPNDNKDSAPSPPALTATNDSLSSPSVTTGPNRGPRAFRHRKIIKPRKANPTNSGALLSELQKTNATMLELAEKVKRAEKRMRNMEKKVKQSSKSTSPNLKLKNTVPIGIRKETRRVYKLLIDEDSENFPGWKIEPGVTFRDKQNQSVVSKLITEVKSLNPAYLTEHIKDSAYRFYRSKCEEESIKRRGKSLEKNILKRRHERLTRKLQERKIALSKASFANTETRKKWEAILIPDFTSTDESDNDDADKEILISHQIPWLSEEVNNFKKLLDTEITKSKTAQALRQMKERKEGPPSSRIKPAETDQYPSWVFDSAS